MNIYPLRRAEAEEPGGKVRNDRRRGRAGSGGVAKAAQDPRSRTAFPPRADGRLHGAGRQLDRHGDRAGDPAGRAHRTAAAGEGAATPASTAVCTPACRQAPIPCGPGEGRAALPAHPTHGLRAGLPQREPGLHRRVLGHAERARLRVTPCATGSPPSPQSPQEARASPGPRASPGERHACVGAGLGAEPLRELRSRSPSGMLHLFDQRAPPSTGPKPGKEATGCWSATHPLPTLSPLHPFPDSQGIRSRCPGWACPSQHLTTVPRACVNKPEQSAPLRACALRGRAWGWECSRWVSSRANQASHDP